MNNEDRSAYFLVHLNTALRGEIVELLRLEQHLIQVLADVRALGDLHIAPHNRAAWNDQWKALDETLQTLRTTTVGKRRRIEFGGGHVPESSPLNGPAITKMFSPLRELGSASLPPGELEHWSDMWRLIQVYADALRSHSTTVDAQMAMRDKYSAYDTRTAKRILEQLPPEASIVDVEKFGEEYRRAAKELKREREQSGGFDEILKAMFMYVEAPGERVRIKHRNEKEEKEEKVSVP